MQRLQLPPSLIKPISNATVSTLIKKYPQPKRPFKSHDHDYHSTSLKASSPCPFSILKIDRKTNYADAKKAFLLIAMANHPDTVDKNLTEREKKKLTGRFQKARLALEALVCDEESGLCVLRSEVEQLKDLEDSLSDSEFDEWLMEETGLNNPFDLDPATMREIAEATESADIGLDRDGGMWTLAKMVSAQVKEAKESGRPVENILKLEAGNGTDNLNNDGSSVRRRRRKRKGSGRSRN